MPGIASTVTTEIQTEIFSQLPALLPQNVTCIQAHHEMTQLPSSAMQDTVVHHCTSDGIHWQFNTARHILKTALGTFGIGYQCVSEEHQRHTSLSHAQEAHTQRVLPMRRQVTLQTTMQT